MLISLENGRTMALTHNIILVIFLSVTNTWAHSQVELKSNELNEGDNGVKLFHKNHDYSSLSKNNLRDGERVRVQLYYEVLDFLSMSYYVNHFMTAIHHFLPYLEIQTYPFGNAKITENNNKVQFECAHGPDECYGNKLHACSLDYLGSFFGLEFNACLMIPIQKDSLGSDDITADWCGKIMQTNTEAIKGCAKGTRGLELMLYYGEQSRRANFSYVPHLLINGKMSDTHYSNLKDEICAAFINPPAIC